MKSALLFLFWSMLLYASSESTSMNGYRLEQFGDFTKWQLVTVRFRKDTDEMRFVYANALAWKTLFEGKTDFPDGAVLAKVGAMTVPDPAFVDSATPSGARRIQFMIRDHLGHKDDDGWGYAIFDPNGKSLATGDKPTTQACVACHRLVPERGEVFSQIFSLQPRPSASGDLQTRKSRVQFENMKVTELPRAVRAFVPKSATTVRSLRGPLRENLFAGSLDEIQPLLATESAHASTPAILLSLNGKDFSLTVPSPTSNDCAKGKVAIQGIHTLPPPKSGVFKNNFCQ